MDTNRLTDATVRRLPVPERGNKITYDRTVAGFGARVTASAHRAFVLTYRTKSGRQRRYTIGSFPDWQTTAAREEARRLRRLIDQGGDPLADIEVERDAPIVNDLIARFLDEHVSRKRTHTASGYRCMIERHVRPALGRVRVAGVRWADIDTLHHKITKAGRHTQANRVLAVLSKMFALAVKWQLRPDNPVKGVERNVEHARKRYLSSAERERLLKVLLEHERRDRQAVDVLRLVLLTGCRVGEAMSARWDQLDLVSGIWTKPGSSTKQKATHITPLSTPARHLLNGLRERTNSKWVFPSSRSASEHRTDISRDWSAICATAGITGVRVHDLRHDFASRLANSGASLPLIGSLLGHAKPTTTARYAHLYDDVEREAVERVGAAIANGGRR